MLSVGVRTHVAAIEQIVVQATAELEGPVVVVTGASRGIGKAVALALGKAGCKVSYLSVPIFHSLLVTSSIHAKESVSCMFVPCIFGAIYF